MSAYRNLIPIRCCPCRRRPHTQLSLTPGERREGGERAHGVLMAKRNNLHREREACENKHTRTRIRMP